MTLDLVSINNFQLHSRVRSSREMAAVGSLMLMMSGSLVYYHCAYRNSSAVTLFADVLIVLLCSLAILGLLFRHMNVAVPVDPLHWQISQDAATSLFACLANTLGAAESVLRVAATAHDKRLFFKVVSCLNLLSVIGRAISGVTVAYIESPQNVHLEILKEEAVARLIELGKVSDADEYLERTFQSPASVRAGDLIRTWMEDAGLHTWVDPMGNVHGRHEGTNSSEKALLIGSHLDTVIDAGMFDGALGIVTAISALKVLKIQGMLGRLRRPVEVIAFSDEEGVRFQSTFLGSAAIAGVLPVSTLHVNDKSGVTVQGALRRNSIKITEESLLQLKYDPNAIWGYIEVHIEQGPVLETVGLPLGLVKGIAGQTRLRVTVKGSQGHAGTVPMAMRHDPMAAAAELIVLLESLCKRPEDYLSYDGECTPASVKSLAGSLVCTVGEISTWPSASNVIPGQVTFTVDIRAMDDLGREAIIYELSNRMHHTCDERSVLCLIERKSQLSWDYFSMMLMQWPVTLH